MKWRRIHVACHNYLLIEATLSIPPVSYHPLPLSH
uniref:Uncharacterized protein n=1 Tax=Rhizophora mucronata TaxID=61149 RepID=A0A2P2QWE7_RHIMU